MIIANFGEDQTLLYNIEKLMKTARNDINSLLVSPNTPDVPIPSTQSTSMQLLYGDSLTPKKPKKSLHPELDKFINSTSSKRGSEFWESNKSDMPQLFKIFSKLRSIQPTSASVERLFSQAKLVYNDLSAKMDPETIFYNLLFSKNFDE